MLKADTQRRPNLRYSDNGSSSQQSNNPVIQSLQTETNVVKDFLPQNENKSVLTDLVNSLNQKAQGFNQLEQNAQQALQNYEIQKDNILTETTGPKPIESQQAQQQPVTPTNPYKGLFGGSNFGLTFGFKEPSKFSKTGFHEGIDIGASFGTPIYSPAGDGIVVKSWDQNNGEIHVYYPATNKTLVLAHTSKQYVNVGDKISEGQLLGEVGKTGKVTGTHLHLGIVDGNNSGTYLNPYNFYLGKENPFKATGEASYRPLSSQSSGYRPLSSTEQLYTPISEQTSNYRPLFSQEKQNYTPLSTDTTVNQVNPLSTLNNLLDNFNTQSVTPNQTTQDNGLQLLSGNTSDLNFKIDNGQTTGIVEPQQPIQQNQKIYDSPTYDIPNYNYDALAGYRDQVINANQSLINELQATRNDFGTNKLDNYLTSIYGLDPSVAKSLDYNTLSALRLVAKQSQDEEKDLRHSELANTNTIINQNARQRSNFLGRSPGSVISANNLQGVLNNLRNAQNTQIADTNLNFNKLRSSSDQKEIQNILGALNIDRQNKLANSARIAELLNTNAKLNYDTNDTINNSRLKDLTNRISLEQALQALENARNPDASIQRQLRAQQDQANILSNLQKQQQDEIQKQSILQPTGLQNIVKSIESNTFLSDADKEVEKSIVASIYNKIKGGNQSFNDSERALLKTYSGLNF